MYSLDISPRSSRTYIFLSCARTAFLAGAAMRTGRRAGLRPRSKIPVTRAWIGPCMRCPPRYARAFPHTSSSERIERAALYLRGGLWLSVVRRAAHCGGADGVLSCVAVVESDSGTEGDFNVACRNVRCIRIA